MATVEKFINLLLQESDLNEKNQTEVDRLVLRMFSNPGLLTHIKDIRFLKDKDTVEIEMAIIPKEQITVIKSLIGPIKSEVFEYHKNREPMVGFRFKSSDLVKYWDSKTKEDN